MPDTIIREARPADYDNLLTLIRQTLEETDAQKSDIFSEELWRWQCLTPGFETLVVVADAGDRLAGCYHLVSRSMLAAGQPGRMALLQELAVSTEFRRHGVFSRMSNWAVEQVTARGWAITYSFPNYRSFPGFVAKLGYTHVCDVPVRVRPLDLPALAADRLPLGGLWRFLLRPVEWLYNALFSPALPPIDRQPTARFTPEVDALSASFLGSQRIGCVRDAAFLNWRFIDKPTGEYTAWTAGSSAEMRAYLVTRRARLFGSDCLVLMDFGCQSGDELHLLALIAHCMQEARADGAALAVTMGLHPFIRRLGRLGFVAVPGVLNPRHIRFIVRAHTDRLNATVTHATNWFVTFADWDVL